MFVYKKCVTGRLSVRKKSCLGAFKPPPHPSKFIDPSDIHFALQDLQDGRKIGAYTDLASGGQQYLSRSRVSTPLHGKRRLVHVLCPLNNVTVKQPTRYETLKSLPDILQPNDFMVSLDIESVFFHVAIAESHRKYFSRHFAVDQLFKRSSKEHSSRSNPTDTGAVPTQDCHQHHHRPQDRTFATSTIKLSSGLTPRCR